MAMTFCVLNPGQPPAMMFKSCKTAMLEEVVELNLARWYGNNHHH
ncbi:hypothetical protein OK016_01200 [Vibrio chagasii]|nr:hypothetical protein [Vibrio chagasii]